MVWGRIFFLIGRHFKSGSNRHEWRYKICMLAVSSSWLQISLYRFRIFEPRDLYLKCLLYHKVSNLKFKFSLPLSLTLVRCAVLILDYFATLCRVCFIHGAIMLIYRLYKPVIFWESLQDICIFDVRGSTSFDLRIDTLKFRVQSSWDKQKQFIYFSFQLWIKSERHIVNIWLVKYKTVESG